MFQKLTAYELVLKIWTNRAVLGDVWNYIIVRSIKHSTIYIIPGYFNDADDKKGYLIVKNSFLYKVLNLRSVCGWLCV